MTTFEITIIVLLAAIAIVITNGVALIVKKMNRIAEQHKSTWAHFDNVVCQLYGTKETVNSIYNAIGADGCNNFKMLSKLTDIVDKMHRNLCVEIADKMVERTFPIKKGEPLDAAFEPDYKLKKDIECKLNGFAAAVLDAECCPKEIVDFWLERICDAAHKYIKQLKID